MWVWKKEKLRNTLGFLRNLMSKSDAIPPQPKESQVNDCNELSFGSQNNQERESLKGTKQEIKVRNKEDVGTSSAHYWVNSEKEQKEIENKVREEEGLSEETKIKMEQETKKNETKTMLKYDTLTPVEQVEEGSKLSFFVPLDQPKKTLNDKEDKAKIIFVQENEKNSEELRTSVNRFDEKGLPGRYSYLPTNHVQVVPRNNYLSIIPNVFVIKKGPNHII